MYFAPFQSFLFCFIGKSREGRPQALGFQWYLFHSHLNASPSSVTEDIQKVMSHIQRSGIFEKFFFSVETEYKMLRNRVSPHLMNNTWVLHQNFETFVFRFKTNLWLWIFQHKTLQPFGITIFIESVRRGRNQRGAAIFFAESLLEQLVQNNRYWNNGPIKRYWNNGPIEKDIGTIGPIYKSYWNNWTNI